MNKQHNVNLEQKIAKDIIDLLDHDAQNLSAVNVAKLASARQQALSSHMCLHKVSAFSLAGISHSFVEYFDKHRALTSSGLALGIILVAFFVVQPFSHSNNNSGSDAFLLGSELPPEAYADKGFDTWLGLDS